MPNLYVHSAAAGAGTGVDWANAYTTLAAAAAASAAGDIVRVAQDHAETNASGADVSMTFASTASNPTYVVCEDRTTGLPAESATYDCSGNVALTLATTTDGSLQMYGITFSIGAGATAKNLRFGAGRGRFTFERCRGRVLNTAAASRVQFLGNSALNSSQLRAIECGVLFSATGQGVDASSGGHLIVHNSDQPFFMAGTSLITTPWASIAASWRIQGFDYTPISATAVCVPSAQATSGLMIDSKIGASQTLTPATLHGWVDTINVATAVSGSARARRRSHIFGSVVEETTIVRTGGATDGTTGYSLKFVSLSTANKERFVDGPEGAIWNDTTGAARTLTIEFVNDGATLTNREVFLEVDFLKTAGSPQSGTASNRQTVAQRAIVTPANIATSTETWTTTGLGSPIKQKIAITFTPQEKGPVRWRLNLAKASTTLYVCPKVTLT